eukprot:7481558-Pyramimonas_sp.AAC.1
MPDTLHKLNIINNINARARGHRETGATPEALRFWLICNAMLSGGVHMPANYIQDRGCSSSVAGYLLVFSPHPMSLELAAWWRLRLPTWCDARLNCDVHVVSHWNR